MEKRFQHLVSVLGIRQSVQRLEQRSPMQKELMHGKQSQITFDKDCLLFQTCPENMSVARYHSLAAEIKTMPECLKVTAKTEDGEVMAVQHKDYPIYGVQLHPESIMTPDGKTMLKNFLQEVLADDQRSNCKNRK